MSTVVPKEQICRDVDSKIKIIIVGAGLGGLGAAIALLLAGHDVEVFEAAAEIAEVGAGIQVLPNSSLILQRWGLYNRLAKYATKPSRVNFLGWKVQARVMDLRISPTGETATVVLQNGEEHTADLVVGADGINSRLREILLGKEDPPLLTGDLAYRLLLSTKDMLKDPELATFVTQPQVNYWLGPDAHAVNYVLRGGELFNMVLLVPDDIPKGQNITEGNVEEMRALYKEWDPRIPKLLSLCESVYKWRLCIRPGMEQWSHPSGTVTMLGDAVHATLPYLASGAGMSLEDGAVLGEIFSRWTGPLTPKAKSQLLDLYQKIRAPRTEMVVERGNRQQWLYHLHDGPEQEERDRILRIGGKGEALAWRDKAFAPELLGWCCEKEVDLVWPAGEDEVRGDAKLQSRL
ncbi:hypothetical protein B7463_g4200, partial [Scytalidium lignicola]